jgi:hypothetical protein
MSVYAVTPEGFRKADEVWNGIRSSPMSVMRGRELVQMEGVALEEMLGRKQAIGLVAQMKDGVVELLEGRRRTPVRDLLRAPPIDRFYGREQELRALDAFLESEGAICVVLGNHGYGTTTLVRRFVQEHDEADVLWVHLREHISAEEIVSVIVSFAKRIRPEVHDLGSALAVQDIIVVFDGYHGVSEEVVEFFAELVSHPGEAKAIITAREDTPAYNWFYQKKHLEVGTVTEIRVRGLDEASARRLLDSAQIEEDAFRRVYLMTRGQPLLLKMLRDGDADGVRKNSVYTAEEILYLLFLRNKTG